jgi:hypothetical protein
LEYSIYLIKLTFKFVYRLLNLLNTMKRTYQEPWAEAYEIIPEAAICIYGGRAGGNGKPGAEFDPDSDIYDYDGLL